MQKHAFVRIDTADRRLTVWNERDESRLRLDLLAFGHQTFLDNAIPRCQKRVLHLHGFEHGKPVPFCHSLPRYHQNGAHQTRHRRQDDVSAMPRHIRCGQRIDPFELHSF